MCRRNLIEGEPTTVRYSLSAPATVSQINIFNEEGNLVFSGPAEKSAGAHEFEWNGRDLLNNPLPSGTYAIRVDSLDLNEEVVETTTVVQSRVRGIEQQDGIVYALVGDRAVPISSIINAVEPPAPEPIPDDTTDDGGANGSA